MRRFSTITSLVAFGVALAALAAACGGGGGSTTTKAEPAKQWAEGVCSAMVTWTSALRTAVQPLGTGNINKDSLTGATGDMKSATSTFVDSIKSLGPPNTSSGQQAKQAVDSLADQLSADVDTIKKAADNVSGAADVPSAVATVSSTATTMGNQLKSTFDDLQKLDTKGELKSAFQSSSSCKKLGLSGG